MSEGETDMTELDSETVERLSSALQCVDDVEGGHSLSLSVLSVCHRVEPSVSVRHSVDSEEGGARRERGVENAQVTASRITFSRKILSTPRVSS